MKAYFLFPLEEREASIHKVCDEEIDRWLGTRCVRLATMLQLKETTNPQHEIQTEFFVRLFPLILHTLIIFISLIGMYRKSFYVVIQIQGRIKTCMYVCYV